MARGTVKIKCRTVTDSVVIITIGKKEYYFINQNLMCTDQATPDKFIDKPFLVRLEEL